MFSTCESQIGVCCDVTETAFWSTKVAAEMYGKSERTIRRLAKDGVLEAYKVEGAFGPEWRIKPHSRIVQSQEKLTEDSVNTVEKDRHTRSFQINKDFDETASFDDKEIIAQLQLRIAEMEQTLQAQKQLEEQRSSLEHRYAIAAAANVQSEDGNEVSSNSNTVLLFWQSVRGILGRYCSYLLPRSDRNEVA
ncbi:MAG: hypothetical protein JST89_24380 [Cyanobacteria bacterium SZAS-4]|nr:hypothetical protein [Cyanobacteria bacterium SZAS-4]